MKTLSSAQYQTVIENNIAMFQRGNTFNRAQLNNMCQDTSRTRYKDIRGAAHYLGLNRQLRDLGLYIKSSNYYANFTVLPLEETQSRVVSYSAESRAKKHRSEKLQEGVVRYSSWNSMSHSEQLAAAQSNWRR
jgi:hypothetical protein